MGSVNKTPNYGLNQWQGNEYPKRQDFNNDNLLIDAALKKLDMTYFADAGTTDAYAITISGITAYSQLLGKAIAVKCNTANTTAASLNINSLGVINIVRGTGTALLTGDITAGKIVLLAYDGTNFQLLSQGADASQASKSEVQTNKTINSPAINSPTIRMASADSIDDANGNELIVFPAVVASAANYIEINNTATGAGPQVNAGGSDTNISLNLKAKGSGTVNMFVQGVLAFAVNAAVSAVNYIVSMGSVAGSAVSLSAQGSDTNIDFNIASKGTGKVKANGVAVATQFVGTTAGTATALTATITGATLADFTNIQVRLHADIGDSATLNLNSLGAKPIYTNTGEVVSVGAVTGSMMNLMYNATSGRWYLLDIMSESAIPNGATATPADDLTTWLKCAGLDPSGYADLAAVIANSTAMSTLCNNLNALKYMVRSPIIIKAVLANSNWVSALKSSTYAVTTPTMTANTTPSGTAYASPSDITIAYKGFNKNYNDFAGLGSASEIANSWRLCYHLDSAVKLDSIMYAKFAISAQTATAFTISGKLQASVNGTTWVDISDVCSGSSAGEAVYFEPILKNNLTKYNYIGVLCTQSAPYGGSYYFYVRDIEVYGLAL